MEMQIPRASLIRGFLLVWLATGLSACSSGHTEWTGAQTMKRNTVELVHLTHDVKLDQDDSLPRSEQENLVTFLNGIGFGYGDELAIDPGDSPGAESRWNAVASFLENVGVSVSRSTAIYGTALEPGGARIVVGRYNVTPPRCPDWSKRAERDYQNTPSSNFGCSTATNIGMMVANPGDLLRGRGSLSPDTEYATRAVRLYRAGQAKEPETTQTGGGQTGSQGGSQ